MVDYFITPFINNKTIFRFAGPLFFALCLFLTNNIAAQIPTGKSQQAFPAASVAIANAETGLFGTGHCFIENKGQYGESMPGQAQMGKIKFGYEGLGMPVLFTPTGLILLQRKAPKLDEEEREKMERKGVKPETINAMAKPEDRCITMEWLHANPDPEIIAEEKTQGYHTYGLLQQKAAAYKKIIYKELYPGIDLVYLFTENEKPGFEYSLILHPGADIAAIKIKFGGDTKKVRSNNDGLLIKTAIGSITETAPVAFYKDAAEKNIRVNYSLKDSIVSFAATEALDKTRTFIIDPFVTATGNLTGLNAGKAKDVDYDYAGNIYITGGGSYTTTHSLAKYNAAGVLQWTFNGTLTIPSWEFGTYYGGWMVEKPTGNIYLGQGFNFSTGFQVIRVSTTGLYDNYITTANQSFTEAWKMYWNCNGGSPQILIAGGGINSSINFGLFAPPSTTVTSLNVTGIPYTGGGGWAQDIADFVFDPANNDMYAVYGSLIGTPSLGNRMYKNTAPYSAASIAWNVPSGYTTVNEAANRPYLVAGGLVDNSANMLWVNASYLYYWDGKNLKAFDKATGAGVGTPLVTANTAFMQGGIIADACDNVFVGEANGNIKVYKFNGTTFNDAAAADITIAGFAGKHVYDLAYDEAKKLLYASGDGFVASVDIAAYCPNTFYTINVVPFCATNTATATVSPSPPAGSTVTYTLYAGGTQASNTTGVFTGITPNTTYSIIATINLPCSGSQASTAFTIPAPTLSTTQVNTTCGASTGTITAAGSGTAGPYSYNINGGTFQASGTFTGLAAGIYTVIVKDAGGCPNSKLVTIVNSNGPALTFTQVNADCGSNNATVTANATGGTSPYQFSINNGVTYQSGNFFTGLLPGSYTLKVKDAAGCVNAAIVTITSSPSPLITAIPAAATCGNNNGTITAFGSNGTGALQYSINGNIFQAANVFTNLTPGPYTVTVKDANGCMNTTAVTIANTAAPTVTATSTPAACSNVNGSITAIGNGGVDPLQYSINGGFYQSSNIFTGLVAGVYTISVKDFTGCVSSISVTVASTNGPAVTATSISSSCNASNGSITATASGGTPAYQYSIDGFTFQAGNTFTGLPAGSYVVYTRDALGCFAAFAIVITNTAGPSVTAVAAAASCSANDGIISAIGTGGTLPYQYSIDGFTFQGTNIFTGLAPNSTYTVTIRDAGGCESTTTATVNNASGLTLTVSTIAASCATSIGVITATASGGTGLLQYSINGTVYQASNIFNGLAAGSYTVYVKDANGCIVTSPATIDAVSSATMSVTTTDETCNSANGIIEITGSGGVPPLTYSINGVTYQSSGIFINVAAGTYTAYVKDGSGCVGTQDVTITNTGAGPGISTFTVTVKGAYLCNGGQGKITNPRVNGSNCGTCTFSLDGGAFIPNATQLFLNVSVGTHTVTAMDASGCTKTIIVTMGVAINSTASAVVTGTACNTSNGSITLTGIGPNTPYHASITGIGGPWVTFDPSTTFTGLAAGTYTIILSDDESFDSGPPIDPGGCLDTITVIVPSIGGPALSITKTNGTCAQNDGTIKALGSGGTAPLEYSIDGSTFQPTGDFTGLPSGTYLITVQDGTGCSNSQEVTIINPTGPEVTALAASASCGLDNGTITATGTGGTVPLQYSIDGFAFQAANVFAGLAPSNYNLYVKDASNCFSFIPVTITAAPLPKVTAFTISTSCNNNDGSIIATGSLGTSPYTYSINGTVFQSSNIFSGLAAGFYTVTIKDDRGCISTTGITIGNIGAPTFTSSIVAAKCGNTNGSITVTASGGTAPYQYSSNGGTSYQPGNVLAALAPGTYTVVVKDFNGCIASKAVLVGNINGPQTLTATVINAACGLSNGTITATATGGVAPLQYSRDGVTYQPGNVLTSVPASNYTLYVRDANLCIKTIAVTVLNLPGPALTVSSSPASCGLNDGTITADATGGTGILTYSKDGTIFQSGNIFLNLAAGPYTITVKDARGCTNTAAVTVGTIGATVTPTFNPVASICAGAALAALPTTSLNGITGTWSPALNNTATTVYTFTPTAGQCATATTLTITVNPNVTPTFNPVAAICSGVALTALPTTSLNGITGTWAPALNNTTTTLYTFTPTAGQCASTTTLTITVNPNVTPTFNPVAAICSGAALAALPTISLNGITGTWSPALNNTGTTVYTFTPSAGQCATTTTLTITVSPNVTPTFNPVATICSGAALAALPTTSLNGITGTWSPALNNTGTTVYTFTPSAGQCSSTTTLTIKVSPNVTPTFNPVAAICSGAALAALPTTSLNGITGTWAPALNNTGTTTYTFTPTAGQCATTTTLTITVNPNVTPTFNPVATICSGGALAALPATSLNGITGTWAPALNNTGTTTYTFTPSAGQCATTTTLTITVNPNVTPTFNAVAAICAGSALAALPTTSLNDIIGTWAPALNNTATTIYTFTPSAGQCASTTTLTITVNPNVTPTFNPVAAICSGAALTALPTTSLNGITGTWSPALNNTTTTVYTFTPTSGQCATTTTLTIAANPNVTPTFNPIAAICSGAALAALPTTSLNGITGTWAPALNNTSTTLYTFTPTAGQCATTTTLTITVSPNITPTFNPVVAICSGAALAALPTTSLNGITGTWAPALNNTSTTLYTFTPGAGQCASTTTLTVSVNPILNATINCGVSTTSSVMFTWAAVTGATGYNISYQVNSNPMVNTGGIGNALSYQVTGLAAGDNVTITVTPTSGAGSCFSASNATCTATACTPPTASISYASPFCASITTTQAVSLSGTGTFTGGTFSALPGLTINSASGAITPSTSTAATYLVTYTIAGLGSCPSVMVTTSVTIDAVVVPTFSPVAAICSGGALAALPTTSLNGITGTWAPALNNIGTTTYTFIPIAGQCATATTLTITVNPNVTPTFNPVAAICSGSALAALPTTSLNGITGTWSPALNNTATTIYTFTPSAGQCASTTTLTITVDPNVTPTFNPATAICSGATLAALPTTSINGITGTWSPALNNTGTTTYTFTPAAAQCATTTILTIAVNPNVIPTFNPVAAICAGAALAALPTISLNGITGIWSPALNNTATTVYTFIPTAGQCATTTTLTITVNPAVTPTFNPVAAICAGAALAALPTTSLNGITGVWSPALDNTATTVYTFIPTAGQCATTTTLTITVNSNLTPTFNAIGSLCQNSSAPLLPATSNNGINGTWNPATISTASVGTTTYTFTPTAGQCANPVSLTVTVATQITALFTPIGPLCVNSTAPALPALSNNGIAGTWNPATISTIAAGTSAYVFTPAAGQCATAAVTLNITVSISIIPIFDTVAAICAGTALAPLPTTSLNGIAGAWSPALNNAATTTYTFTPAAGQCAATTTLTITVNPTLIPTFIAIGPLCQNSAAPLLPSTSNNGISGTWSPAVIGTSAVGSTIYTFTPSSGQCATTAILAVTIATQIIPVFAAIGPLCQNSIAPVLPATSNNGINGTWSPATIGTTATGTTVYTFTPATGQCASAVATLNITVTTGIVPSFNPVAAVCTGAALAPLPTTSLNGITGNWSPALNNIATTIYTFTPTAGQCASTATLTITVNPKTAPTFNTVAAICSGDVLSPLPTTSLNGITGSWSPALDNTATTIYTFTPAAGQCATTTTLAITVNPKLTPAFNPVTAICTGTALAALPTMSLNGITGSWSPALDNTATTIYTFTPTAGQCATTTTLAITVNPKLIPTFNPVTAICTGTALVALPTMSLNGITGSWSPALDNTATTTYTFTPSAGQCASTITLTITVNPKTTPTFDPVAAICSGDVLSPLPTTSLNGIAGSWSPVLNNIVTTTYAFTPAAGQCAVATNLTITVNPAAIVFAGRDTIVAINQPFAFNATDVNQVGFISYLWSPAGGLNNPFIKNPVAMTSSDITYTVTARTANGCEATDDIKVSVNRVAEIYVPGAFSPGGYNNLLRAIPVGIKEFRYFVVYNRWGQEVFSTSNPATGWDGKYKGIPQNTGGFVWIAEGISYTNKLIQRKGNVVLIR